jgi:hypothetical protein
VFSKSADYGFKGAGSGFPQLVRETLSENAMLPGLTYFYCNSVSQEEREALGCGARKEDRTVSAVRQAPLPAIAQGRLSRKAREGAHPQLFRAMLKDKSALYFGVKVAHPPARANSITLGIHQVLGRNQFCFFLLLPTLARTTLVL